jgi:hypothetical protein
MMLTFMVAAALLNEEQPGFVRAPPAHVRMRRPFPPSQP